MNCWDVLILVLVACAPILAVRTMRGKKGKRGCSCDCMGCVKDCPVRQEDKPKTNG